MSQKDKFGIALQSAVGTKVTTMAWWIPVGTAEFKPDRKTLDYQETVGIRVPTQQATGSKLYTGSIEGATRPNSVGALLGAAFGTPTTACTTACSVATYQHTFDPCATGKNPRPFSAMSVFADPGTPIVQLHYDCFLNAIEFSAQADDYLMFKTDVVALHLDTTQSNPAITSDSTTKFTYQNITACTTVSGCSAEIPLTNFRVRWNNNIEPDPVLLGDTEATSATPGSVTIEGDMEVSGSDNISAHVTRALLDTPEDVSLRINVVGANIGVSNVPYKFVIDIKKLNYTDAPIAISGSDTLKTVKITFGAFLDESTSKAIEFTVVNNNAGTTY